MTAQKWTNHAFHALGRINGDERGPLTSTAQTDSFWGLWLNMGMLVGLGTLLITVLLEVFSMPCVRAITSAPGGKLLYAQAWFYTILNALVFGPPVYATVERWLVHDRSFDAGSKGARPHALFTIVSIAALLLVHSLGYWYAHKTMHTSWLWWAHRFHHRFSTHVTPCVAMAVSPAEYLLAYMTPFVVGGFIVRPDHLSLLVAVCVVSLCNLLVHTKKCLGANLPWFLVSPDKHLEHHRRPNKHYSAPTFDVDAILVHALKYRG